MFCGCGSPTASRRTPTLARSASGIRGAACNQREGHRARREGRARAQLRHRGEGGLRRKNYFYPDLPKGYQISDLYRRLPRCALRRRRRPGRHLRLHLEEDAAKNVHVGESGRMHGSVGSLVDFNRGGTPLMEIVTEPDIPRPRRGARRPTTTYRAIASPRPTWRRARCDANVSIRNPDGTFGTKTELKNMNSFRFVERGLARELERQRRILESGGVSSRQRLHYDPDDDEVHELRSKEYAHDYRYFPSPTSCPWRSRRPGCAR